MLDFESTIYEVLASHHIYIDGYIDFFDPEIQRFRVKNHYKRGKPLFVCIHYGGASFGDWRNPSTWHTWWYKPWNTIDYAEKKIRKETLENIKNVKLLNRQNAIIKSKSLINHRACKDANPYHPYVISKHIVPYYAKQIRSYLIIPIYDIGGDLQSLQYIKPNGQKRFKKNATPKDGFAYIGEKIDENFDTLWICEGWATGCTIYEAIGQPVICALSASNIQSVANQLRLKFPNNEIIICADNDKHLSTNIGVELAYKAAHESHSIVAIPSISGDFNDLAISHGIEEVISQLLNQSN